MSTFAKASFDAVAYAAARPTYPPALFHSILSKLSPPTSSASPRTLLDLGCGPGLSTFDWAPLLQSHPSAQITRVIGVDPSPGMVSAARATLAGKTAEELGGAEWSFEVGQSDRLKGIVEDSSVDLAIAGQAAHWFDPVATYSELSRVLKPGGWFAFWGYGEFFFPGRPELSALIPPYSAGTLGPFWQQPGRSIVEALLTPFPFPHPTPALHLPATHLSAAPPPRPSPGAAIPVKRATDDDPCFAAYEEESFRREFWLREGGRAPFARDLSRPSSSSSTAPGWAGPKIELHPSLLLRKRWTLAELHAYLRTWSAAHSFNEAHSRPLEAQDPLTRGTLASGDVSREQAKRMDCTEVFVERLRDAGLGEGEEEVAWEVGVMMGRKKE